MLEKQAPAFESINSDQQNRLWAYKLHEEDIFYNRLNFFLVFESVLLGVVGLLYSRSYVLIILRLVDILGLILTVLWGYVQARQLYTYTILVDYLKEVMPEYKIVVVRRNKWFLIGSSKKFLTYLVPTLIILMWIAFLFLG